MSSEEDYDALTVSVDGEEKARLSGERGWERRTIEIVGAGGHRVVWTYRKDGSVSRGADCGWVDAVAWAAVLPGFDVSATVSSVTARQRYPWNGLVDIDYTITGEDAANAAFVVKVVDGGTGRVYTPTKFLETPSMTAGRHRLTWDTAAEGVRLVSSNMTVRVSLVRRGVPPPLFYVIDLSFDPYAGYWPVTCLSAEPPGGWTDEYKTNRLVLRRVEAGSLQGIDVTYGNEFADIDIDQPYYIGVFEVTAAQYAWIMGGYFASSDSRPQKGVSYERLRGTLADVRGSDPLVVDAKSLIGILREKTGLRSLDLPTEQQWEYACRAGTTCDFNNGGSTEADLMRLGRFKGNGMEGRGGYVGGVTAVGSYEPNKWGFYDMHGNVAEWCRGWYSQGDFHVLRGGCNHSDLSFCRSGARGHGGRDAPSHSTHCAGFRLCCSAEL